MKIRVVIELVIEFIILCFGLWVNRLLIYVLFLVCVIPAFIKKGFNTRTMWEVAIYSIMLPDNYSTIVLMAIPAIITILRRNTINQLKTPRILWLTYALLMVAVISTLFHSVPILNVAISLIYFSSAFFAILIIGKGCLVPFLPNCEHALSRLIRIEVMATVINFAMLLAGKKAGDDWSTGTLGGMQQSQVFLIFMLFSFVMLTYYFGSKERKKKYLALAITAIIGAVSTKCWAQLGLTIVFIVVGYITIADKKTVKRFLIVLSLSIVLVAVLGKRVVNTSVGNQVIRIMTDEEYRAYRASKLDAFYSTFIVIPKKDVCFLFIGNGLGWYSSRAALTCTGAYIASYNEFFPNTMSSYTRDYIYPGLLRAYYNSSTDYGSVIARPYSTVISIMGEVGLIGLVLCIFLLAKTAKKYGHPARFLILIWLASCFIENYLEYSKIILFLMICLYLVNDRKKGIITYLMPTQKSSYYLSDLCNISNILTKEN